MILYRSSESRFKNLITAWLQSYAESGFEILELVIANKNVFVFQISVVIHTTISKFYNKTLYP
jgi:hypothetical protein